MKAAKKLLEQASFWAIKRLEEPPLEELEKWDGQYQKIQNRELLSEKQRLLLEYIEGCADRLSNASF